MHETNIEILRNEAQRLIDLEIELLTRMMNEAGVIVASQPGEPQTFDCESVRQVIEILNGERTKLDQFEMVLAVVGSMKAGKSTAINAIVGTEVLPNRNRPMTALPTLIRHTVGQHEPRLRFDNDQPIKRLLGILRTALAAPENQLVVQRVLITEPDMEPLISFIRSGGTYATIGYGADAIFSFLKGLNDLVRLSQELNIPFPFEDYNEIHELPVIEVQFAHLPETKQAAGRLTLLDTPGPDEDGQPHLRTMLREQLRKASAVLAVLDFTKLKSEADAEIRQELQKIADQSDGRLFVLVNKFDQKDRHGDTEDQLKSFVSVTLMNKRICADQVFPVSSRWAYLANRARHELSVNHRLPDPIQHPWVADFGEEALGKRWERKIDDLEEVRESADHLWIDSLFTAPLDSVIHMAHARAAAFAVDAAAAKLVDTARRIDTLLTIRETALTKTAKELQAHISALQTDIVRVESCETKARRTADSIVKELTDRTVSIPSTVRSKTETVFKDYFEQGKANERQEHEKKAADARKRSKRSPRKSLFSMNKNQHNSSFDFDPNDPVVKFSSKNDAEKFAQKIEYSISAIIKGAEEEIKEAMDSAVNQFRNNFSFYVLETVESIVGAMESRLKDNGFRITLTVPSAAQLSLGFSGSDLLTEHISHKSEKVKRTRRQTGLWGIICEVFSTTDWGWEDYEETNSYYELDIRAVQTGINTHIDRIFSELLTAVEAQVRKPVIKEIDEFFYGFKKAVEQIRGDLLQSIRDQENSKDEQAALSRRLGGLKEGLPSLLGDAQALKEDIIPLVGAFS